MYATQRRRRQPTGTPQPTGDAFTDAAEHESSRAHALVSGDPNAAQLQASRQKRDTPAFVLGWNGAAACRAGGTHQSLTKRGMVGWAGGPHATDASASCPCPVRDLFSLAAAGSRAGDRNGATDTAARAPEYVRPPATSQSTRVVRGVVARRARGRPAGLVRRTRFARVIAPALTPRTGHGACDRRRPALHCMRRGVSFFFHDTAAAACGRTAPWTRAHMQQPARPAGLLVPQVLLLAVFAAAGVPRKPPKTGPDASDQCGGRRGQSVLGNEEGRYPAAPEHTLDPL
jgi:hypothetical protein